MSVAVITAITGSYDVLKSHPNVPDVDFWCFTDDPELKIREDWRIRLLPPSDSPRMAAKAPKILPHRFPELAGYEYTIWVDGNCQIKDGFLDCLDYLGEDGFVLHKHPGRDDIFEEAQASLRVAQKYDGQPIMAQVAHYRSLGHPEHWGLWACGSFARKPSEKLHAAMDAWYDEIAAWTVQDQLSLPFVARTLDFHPESWPYSQPSSPWFQVCPHGR